jgi:hypothetical protein
VVVEWPSSLPDAEGLVLKGSGFPTGDASNRAAAGPAVSENPIAGDFFFAADDPGFVFGAGFLFVVTLDFFAADFFTLEFFAINQILSKPSRRANAPWPNRREKKTGLQKL